VLKPGAYATRLAFAPAASGVWDDPMLTGEEKSAWLLKALGPEAMTKVMSQLGPERSARLRALMQRLKPRPEVQQALSGLVRELDEALRGNDAPEPLAATVPLPATVRFPDLTPAPPPPKQPAPAPPPAPESPAHQPSSAAVTASPAPVGDPLAALARMPAERLALVLDGENPRSVAMILNYLDGEHAGLVFKGLAPGLRSEVIVQLNAQGAPNPQVLERIAHALVLKSRKTTDKPQFPEGTARWRRLADMLRLLEKPDRLELLTVLETKDAAGAAAIKEMLYRFDDVLRLDNRSMQKILGEVDLKNLAVALKGAEQEIVDKVLGNLSKRAQENLSEEMDLLQTPAKDQVEQAQKEILAVLQRMDLAGELAMSD
jgi:flagellar motor switch protein FliG